MPVLPQLRISTAMLGRLDALADARGVKRPELVRTLLGSALGLAESDPDAVNDAGDYPDGSADLSETLVLLSDRARHGVVSAQVALLRHHSQRSNGTTRPSDPLAELDEIAARRLREMAEADDPDGDGAA